MLRLLVIGLWPVVLVFARVEMVRDPRWAAVLSPERVPWIAVAGFVLALVYYGVAWLRVGRDPRRGTIVVRYEAPRGLSPAAMRSVWRMAYDDKAFIAALLSMVAKSCAEITRQDQTYSVRRTGADMAMLLPEERTLADALFPGPEPLPLTLANQTRISTAISRFKMSLAWNVERLYYRVNRGYVKNGLLICLLAVQASIILGPGDAAENAFMGFVGLYFLTVWLGVVGILLYFAAGLWKLGARGDSYTRGIAAAMFAFLFVFLSTAAALLLQIGQKTSYWNPAVMIAAPLLAILFHHFLKSPTRAGRALLDEIEGYRTYLQSAEAGRLKRLNTPNDPPDLRDKHLAYAVALDVENAWDAELSAVLDATGQLLARHSAPAA